MENPLFVKITIQIRAPASKVWAALTRPEETKKYMFGCETVSDWKKGSPLEWKAVYEGKEVVFVKGSIRDIQPGKFLAYTTFDPNAVLEDVPENYLVVTYDLSENQDSTTLVVTQGDYSLVADGERRYKEAANN